MSDLAIHARKLAKRYSFAKRAPAATLREALANVLGGPFAGRHEQDAPADGYRRDLWALREVDLDVRRGEVLGIIGRNGAGKSTLLKVLAGITEPTTGYAEIHGRVGCLLEVGTGFHLELSGRDNIFMNGALLGLSRREIRRRFAEIVAFAETEEFIDMPVKHYSSGMYMRLAFAVAAHLDPEILIVDEVLAVGDAQFQRKCIGKMHDVARSGGRTILFVSHNTAAIQRLCSRCVLIDGGRIVADGPPRQVVAAYLSPAGAGTMPRRWIDVSGAAREGTGEAWFTTAWYSGTDARRGFAPYSGGALDLRLAVTSDAPRAIDSLAVTLHDLSGTRLINADTVVIGRTIRLAAGRTVVGLHLDALHLNPGRYRVALWLANPRNARSPRGVYDHVDAAFDIEVVPRDPGDARFDPHAPVACSFALVDVAYDHDAALPTHAERISRANA